MPNDYGHIVFPGSPWPSGHAIDTFAWSARIEADESLWFDLHLVTEDYDGGDPDSPPEDDDSDDWVSPGVWRNYHRCILSSTYWDEDVRGAGGIPGIRVPDELLPLDFSSLDAHRFLVDSLPSDPHAWPRPFAIYLLGHDAVAGHEVCFRRSDDPHFWNIDWLGRIALVYAHANAKFDHEFIAHIRGVPFTGIQLAEQLPQGSELELARRLVVHYEGFTLNTNGADRWIVPNQ